MSFKIDGEIRSFSYSGELGKEKAVITYTNNVIEQGQVTPKEYSVKVNRRISDDFKSLLRFLIGHALFFADLDNGKIDEKYIKSRKSVDDPEFKDYEFSALRIVGDGEKKKVSIILNKKCTKPQAFMKLPIPAIPMEDGTYLYEEFLSDDVENVISQIHDYLAGKNYFVQSSLDFQEENQEELQEDEQY